MSSSSHRRQRRSLRRPIVPRRRGRPSHAPVQVRVERYATVTTLHLSGEFDLWAVDQVERRFERALDAVTDQVVFDLRGVTFLDLCGLKLLLRADARARSEAFAVAVVPPPGVAARIFAAVDAGRRLALLDEL